MNTFACTCTREVVQRRLQRIIARGALSDDIKNQSEGFNFGSLIKTVGQGRSAAN